jgi:hypothetical protein
VAQALGVEGRQPGSAAAVPDGEVDATVSESAAPPEPKMRHMRPAVDATGRQVALERSGGGPIERCGAGDASMACDVGRVEVEVNVVELSAKARVALNAMPAETGQRGTIRRI